MNEIPQHLLRRAPDKADFQAKLTEAERCGILALHIKGVRVDALALAFNIHKRTVGHIVNPHSTHYKTTRAEHKRLGTEDFLAKYATEEVVQRILSVPVPAVGRRAPDASHHRKAGIHVVKPEQCAYSHRLEIRYLDDRDPVGWYYRDLDSKGAPGAWFHNGPDSLATSQACLALAEVELTDD